MHSARGPVITGFVSESVEVESSVDRVWLMFADQAARATWLKLPGRDRTTRLDFREGGSEHRTSVFPNIDHDERLDIRNQFVEVDAPRRLVEMVEIRLDEVLRTVSLIAWELTSIPTGTAVSYTEQYQVLVPTGDGTADAKERKGAVPMMLRGLKIAAERVG